MKQLVGVYGRIHEYKAKYFGRISKELFGITLREICRWNTLKDTRIKGILVPGMSLRNLFFCQNLLLLSDINAKRAELEFAETKNRERSNLYS